MYTDSGINIINQDGDLALFDLQTGNATENSDCEVMFDFARRQAGEIIGKGRIDDETFSFAK